MPARNPSAGLLGVDGVLVVDQLARVLVEGDHVGERAAGVDADPDAAGHEISCSRWKVVLDVELATTLPDATTYAGAVVVADAPRGASRGGGRPGRRCRRPRGGDRPRRARSAAVVVTRVVDEVDAGGVDRLERVRGEERDLDHVVAAERVVGVLDVVLAQRDRHAHRGQLAHRQVQRPGVRVADEAEAGPLHEAGEPLERRAGVEADRAGVVGDALADQAVLEHRLGEHLGGPQARVARVVDQHRDPAAVRRREPAHPLDVLARLGVGVLDPRDAADDVGAEVDRVSRPAPPPPGRGAVRPAGTRPPAGRPRRGTPRAGRAAGSRPPAARGCRRRRRPARGVRRTAPPRARPCARWARSTRGRSRP